MDQLISFINTVSPSKFASIQRRTLTKSAKIYLTAKSITWIIQFISVLFQRNLLERTRAIVILAYVSLVFRVISLLVNLLLLGSCSSGDKRLAFPWLGWSIFKLFFSFGVFIFYIAIWDGFADVFIVYIIEWLLSVWSEQFLFQGGRRFEIALILSYFAL